MCAQFIYMGLVNAVLKFTLDYYGTLIFILIYFNDNIWIFENYTHHHINNNRDIVSLLKYCIIILIKHDQHNYV